MNENTRRLLDFLRTSELEKVIEWLYSLIIKGNSNIPKLQIYSPHEPAVFILMGIVSNERDDDLNIKMGDASVETFKIALRKGDFEPKTREFPYVPSFAHILLLMQYFPCSKELRDEVIPILEKMKEKNEYIGWRDDLYDVPREISHALDAKLIELGKKLIIQTDKVEGIICEKLGDDEDEFMSIEMVRTQSVVFSKEEAERIAKFILGEEEKRCQ